MRIEQRIGRVDRIGQKHPVKAFNLIFEDSVELRIQEVLEEKLATILDEFGVDKTQDVLDSAESGAMFERLYADAIIDPAKAFERIDSLVMEVREQAVEAAKGKSCYAQTDLNPLLAQQLSSHPLPFWVERMTTSWLRSEGGKVRKDLFGYSLEWPDGSRMNEVCFQSRVAQDHGLQYVNLEDVRIRRLIQALPRVASDDAIQRVRFPSLPAEVTGYWSLWRIAITDQSAAHAFREAKIVPIFHHDDGRNLIPTARHIWDILLEDRPELEQLGIAAGNDAKAAFQRLWKEAEKLGADAFHDLCARYQQRLKREREKGQYAFQVRKEALVRLGLPEVRRHRLKRLAEEEQGWAEDLRSRQQILPDLQPIILLRVEAGHG